MVAGYVLTSNKATQNKNDAAAAKAEADSLEAEVAQRGAFTNFSQIKETRLASVSGVFLVSAATTPLMMSALSSAVSATGMSSRCHEAVLASLLESYEADILPWLEPLDRLVTIARIDGDLMRSESVLLVE